MQQYVVAEGKVVEFKGELPWSLSLDAYGRDWVVVEATSEENALHQARLFDKNSHPAQTEMELFAAAMRGMEEEEALRWAGWSRVD